MSEFVTKGYCAMRERTVNFLLTTLAVIIVCFLGIATFSYTVANDASNQLHAVESNVANHLGTNEQFRERVLTDLQEIKTQLKHLQERGE